MSQGLMLRHYLCNRPGKMCHQPIIIEKILPTASLTGVHSSVAMHEVRSAQLRQIFQEVYRASDPGGLFILVDFHRPTNPVFWSGLDVFLWFLETETACKLSETELGSLLAEVGWRSYNSEEAQQPKIYAGGSIQVIQVQKSVDSCQLTVDSCH